MRDAPAAAGQTEIERLAGAVVAEARAAGALIAAAESCTGGLLGAWITTVAGSSDVFWGSLVTYANAAKESLLGVCPATLANHGAVSEETVREMAIGARDRSGAAIAVSVSGVAGPGGGTPEKPVGTVWLGWATVHGAGASLHRFDGDRAAVRQASVREALFLIRRLLANVDTPQERGYI